MYLRLIRSRIDAALADTPVVLLNGARQTGKTTLAREIAAQREGQYATLDDATTLASAAADPSGFLANLGAFAVIDEVQRVPEIFLAIKLAVDRDRAPGRLLLTGSANVLTLPRIADSLAGRMEVLPLHPLSQAEIVGARGNVIDLLFSHQSFALGKPRAGAGEPDLADRMVRGGFPEAVDRNDEARRDAWFASYITTILQRDVRDLAHVDGLATMPRLLQHLAALSSRLLSYSDLSRSAAMPQTTLKRYLALFETVFLLNLLPAWSINLGSRLIKSPKVHLRDTGLAAHLMGMSRTRMSTPSPVYGQLLETFVVGEFAKLAASAQHRVKLYHYRTFGNREVDLVLENADGRVIGIEVKSASQVDARDFAGLRSLAEDAGERFAYGLVLHSGGTVASFGNGLQAAPISSLWRVK